MKDDAGLEFCVRGRARYALAHVQNDEVTIVFQVNFSAGCCDMRNLSASFARPKAYLRKATIEGPIAPQADITIGVKIVLFPPRLAIT